MRSQTSADSKMQVEGGASDGKMTSKGKKPLTKAEKQIKKQNDLI